MAINPPSTYSLPRDSYAEKAILGAILRDPKLMTALLDKMRLTEDHFFDALHRRIFQAMLDCEKERLPIDIGTTVGRSVLRDEPEAGVTSYLIELEEKSPLSLNVDAYAGLIKKKYYLRSIIKACQDTAEQAMSTDGDVTSFIEQVERQFLEISKEQDASIGLLSAKEALHFSLESIEKRILAGDRITGVPSGFRDLDHITGGWQDSDLIILAARPGMGKTALALNWAMNAIKGKKERKVAIFTLEMSKEQLVERLLSAEGRVDSSRLRKGELDEDDQDRLMQAAREIDRLGLSLMIDETPGISLMELRSRCRRLQRESSLDMIIVDYLQLMSGSLIAQKQSREREISEISMGLKGLAKELSVPIIALAQLNRGPDARPDKKPKISDLRESGSMEQDADQILFVYRDEYYNPNSEHAGKAEVIIAKNRHGETGSIHLAWLPSFVSFHNLHKDS